MNNTDAPPVNEAQHTAVLRAVFDQSSDLVYATNQELQVAICNTRFRKLVRNHHPEGMHLRELGFNAEAIAEHRAAIAHAEAGHVWHPKLELCLNGLGYADCSVTAVPPLLIFHFRHCFASPPHVDRDHPDDPVLLKELFTQAADDQIAIVDRELRYTSFNSAYQKTLRRVYGHDLHPGDRLTEVLRQHPQHRELLEHLFKRALDDETAHQTLDFGEAAESRRLSMGFYPLRGEGGQIIGVGHIILDITERAKAEDALRESEQRFQALADNMPPLVWMADAEGRVIWVNQRWREFTRTTPKQMGRLGWRHLVHPDHLRSVLEQLQHSWDSGEVWEGVLPMKGKSGAYHWFQSRALPIRDRKGRVKYWFGSHTDITQQRAAEEALHQADHNRDRFLATLAHELRNPMAPLRSALETLRLSDAGQQQNGHAQLYDMMNRQIDQLVRLIDDLLEVSRLTRGRIKLRKEVVDVADVVRSALESTEPLIHAAGHRLQLSMPPGEIPVYGDRLRLTQVLINLLDNAIKYTDPGGNIWLSVSTSCRNDKPHVVVTVRDDGKGIDAVTLPYIFDSFVQLAEVRQIADRGLGIGLSIVRSLVEMHGGSVAVVSKGIGQGAQFIITLPLDQARSQPEDAERIHDGLPTRATRTLVVDDNVDAAQSLGDLLTLLGNEVCVVHSGRDALAVLDDFDPGLILLDIDMPEMDGYEVARRLRQRPENQQRHLVALTGFGREKDRQRAMAAGFDRHLVKPVDLVTLRSLYAPG